MEVLFKKSVFVGPSRDAQNVRVEANNSVVFLFVGRQVPYLLRRNARSPWSREISSTTGTQHREIVSRQEGNFHVMSYLMSRILAKLTKI